MAITHRLYRTAKLGQGTITDRYRSALSRYIIEDGTGATFENWVMDPVQESTCMYALASAESSVHAICEADPDITPMSPEFSTILELEAWLEEDMDDLEDKKSILKGDRIPTKLPTTIKRREFWRHIAKFHRIGNWMRSERDTRALEFLIQNPDAKMKDLDRGVSNYIRGWMRSKGIDDSMLRNKITDESTVEDVLDRIVNATNIPPCRFVRLRF